ncbi:Lnb N-terminal periplasmic domain-containing protein [Hyalangium versicolor]|uniref:Lnb N-terminal periplasmic domain-containing protein n=1 Tax=Hyalangium versicolor TaxID=2861190 RepID=UPI001CCE45EC|nr:DUF4105 domain-containing protein [Hyalangium versicolor]
MRLLALAVLLSALPAGADEAPLAERVAALEAGYGVVLRSPASEDAALVAEVEAGLAALPVAMRHFPGGLLELELHAESAPLGLGDGSPAWPEWTEEHRRFHLYRYASSLERRATFRLSRLSDEEAERLWRRRAVVHAVVQRWDDARGWSRGTRWRRLSGWRAPFERLLTFHEEALLNYTGAFSRVRGQASASLDLVTFAEELFVPVESLRSEALAVDDQVRCQEFSKARALGEIIAAEGLGQLPPRGRCPAFDAWADVENLSHFEVMLVAASGRQPESLFGHLMMRPVWREGAVPRGPGFTPVVQLVALTGLEARSMGYVLKGLFGGYDTGFLTTTLGDLSHETLELEQRSMRRFRMRLTPSEQVRLIERIWELERRGYFPYRFFTDNCASALLFLLNGVLEGGRQVRQPGQLWVLPSATLDVLARTEVVGADGSSQPLLEYVPDDLESTEARAARAYASREEALAGLGAHLSPEARSRLRLLHWRLRSPQPEVRRAAYEWMPKAIAGMLRAASPEDMEEVRTLLHAYVAWSVRVERGAVDRSAGEKLEVERAQVLALRTRIPPAAESVSDRQRQFEREDELQRRLAVLDRISLLQEALAHAPRRPATAEETLILERAEATEAAFVAATDAQGVLQDGVLASADPVTFLAEDQRAKVEASRAWAEGAIERSGASRMAVGLGIDFPAAGGSRPVVLLQTAGLSEALGDARLHGFQPGSELRALEGELSLLPRKGVPRVLGSRFTLVGYRTLVRELPLHQHSVTDALGWGVAAQMESLRDHPAPYRATVQAEVLAVVDDGPRFRHFTALGAGVKGGMHWGAGVLAPVLGPRFSLSHRTGLPGSLANAVRLEAEYSPFWRAASGVTHEALTTLQVDLRLGRLGRYHLLFSPRAQLRWEGRLGARLEGSLERRLTLGMELS